MASKAASKRDITAVAKPAAVEPSGASSYHHGGLRTALIAAGRAALEEIGPRELSLRSVAKAVGVSEAAPSRHFAGKEGLLAAMAAEGFAELAQLRSRIAHGGESTEDKVRAMMSAYVHFAQRQPGLFDLMIGPRILQPGLHAELKDAISASFRLFADSVCELGRACGWPTDKLNLLVHSAWAVEHGLATLIVSARAPVADWPVAIDDMIDFSMSLFLQRVTRGPA